MLRQLINIFPRQAAKCLTIGVLLLTVFVPSCSTPVKADNIDPKLEKQVLEIIRKNPEVILEAVDNYQRQEQEKQAKARQEVINQFTKNPKAAMGNSPTLGKGKVLLVEFSDFQCPYCAAAHKNVKEFLANRLTDVTLVYKHLPLEQIHPEALPAAKASWAAQQQGKFWEYHDALFANQKQLNDAFYQETAKKLGLDLAKFNRDRASQGATQAVNQDLGWAEKLRLNGTPTFIMNGQLFSGSVPVKELEERLSKK
jgi:protein-disulfide isomerase